MAPKSSAVPRSASAISRIFAEPVDIASIIESMNWSCWVSMPARVANQPNWAP